MLNDAIFITVGFVIWCLQFDYGLPDIYAYVPVSYLTVLSTSLGNKDFAWQLIIYESFVIIDNILSETVCFFLYFVVKHLS